MAEGEPLRILVIGNLPPYVLGGAENQIARLAEAWAKLGAKVEVAGHRIPKGQVCLGQSTVRTHHLSSWPIAGRPGKALGYFFSVGRLVLVHRNKIDVVYCRGMGDGLLSLVLLKWLRLCSWPIVACPINARGAGDVAFIKSVPAWKWWTRLIDRHVDVINLINASITEDLASIEVTSPQLSHIPNGIEVRSPPARSPPQGTRKLIWTGRMDLQKGLDLLLAALAQYHMNATFQLDLVGDGDQREQLERQAAELGLASRVCFRGPVPAEEIRSHLEAADVFVLPSRYEGMSNSALEAMEAGLPVLCTACGGIDTYIGDYAGWTCKPYSIEALAVALGQMLSDGDDELLRRGAAARRLIEQHFSLDKVATANLHLLQLVAASGTSA